MWKIDTFSIFELGMEVQVCVFNILLDEVLFLTLFFLFSTWIKFSNFDPIVLSFQPFDSHSGFSFF